MFKNRQHGIARLHFLMQQLGVLAGLWLCYGVVSIVFYGGDLRATPYAEATFVMVAAALLDFVTRQQEERLLCGLSRRDLASVSRRQTLLSLVILFGAMVMFKDDSLSRIFLVCFFTFYFFWISWSNQLGYRILHRFLYRTREQGRAATVLVGTSTEVERYITDPNPPKPPGMDVVGYVSASPDGTMAITESTPLLGTLEDLRRICEECKARALVLLGLSDRRDLLPSLTQLSNEMGLRAIWVEDVNRQYGRKVSAYTSGRYSVVSHLAEPLEDPWNRMLKRVFDLAVSLFGIFTLLLPAMIFVATVHLIFSRGPLFFRQERSGRNGEPFSVYKFRSMTHVSGRAFQQATKKDARIFYGGQFLRKWSIDELPQLINVFLGQMSIVGPRPHPVDLDAELALRNPTYRLRNLAKPGITGLAQSRGWRGSTADPKELDSRIRLDLFYIQHWCFSLDIRIIVETAWQLVFPPDSAH